VLQHPIEFGKYMLLEEIGIGGMARVYRAVRAGPMGFRKEVAIKQILPQVAKEKKQVKALINEARLGGYLHHRNLVETYEFDRVGTVYYIAMEYVNGFSMEQILRRVPMQGRVPPRIVAQVAMQLCAGLGHAHAAVDDAGTPLHLVHRDLKPGNVMIDRRGVVKIMDFGVARSQTNLFRTQTIGMTKGTPAYMSPEQTTGEQDAPLDRRSDLFSLGSLIAEMLTGEVSFPGERLYEVLHKIAHAETTPVLKSVRECCPEMAPILSKALKLKPQDRYQSAEEMGHDIQRVYEELPGEEKLGAWLPEWMQGEHPETKPLGSSEIDLAAIGTWGSDSLGSVDAVAPAPDLPADTRRWGWIAAGAVAVVLAGAVGATAVMLSLSRHLWPTEEPQTLIVGVGAEELAPDEPTADLDGAPSDDVAIEVAIEDVVVPPADAGEPAPALPEERPALIIASTPPAADVYLGSRKLGRTAYRYEQGTAGSAYSMTLKKSGYEDTTVGGVFPFSGTITVHGVMAKAGDPPVVLPVGGTRPAAEVVTPSTVAFIVGSNASVRACFLEERARGGAVPDKVWIRFDVQPDGRVTSSRLVTEGVSGTLEQCVTSRVDQLRFEPFAGSDPKSARYAFDSP